jgi:DNA-binding GntR family transcriptional regulator
LFYWRDVSGHEIDVVVDHGSYATGIELKSGMTVVPDFFKGLTFWEKLTKYEQVVLLTASGARKKIFLINGKNHPLFPLSGMEAVFNIDSGGKTPKYLQVVDSINNAIRQGKYRKGDQIFSINELSDECLLGRDTVQKAYNILRKKGVLVAVKGKGFYINRTDVTTPYRVLLLFNKISNYKKQIYNAFVQTMGTKALVDLKIHHFNTKIFEGLLMDHFQDYDYYVIMPHFYENEQEINEIIKKIPPEKLLILDKDLSCYTAKYAAVYQDFRNDIYEALEEGLDLLGKYQKLILVHPLIIPYPPEIRVGFRNFCMHHDFACQIIHEIDPETKISPGECYIVIEETDLVNLIKICRSERLRVGKHLGIISYNDTPLKEILMDGITVISTHHAKMGETAARLILEGRKEKIKNPFMLIRRKSL